MSRPRKKKKRKGRHKTKQAPQHTIRGGGENLPPRKRYIKSFDVPTDVHNHRMRLYYFISLFERGDILLLHRYKRDISSVMKTNIGKLHIQVGY